MNPGSPPAEAPLPEHHQGLQACRSALQGSLLALAPLGADGQPAAAVPAHPVAAQIWCVDHDFGAWPLDAPEVLQALTAWLRAPGRRLVLIGVDFEATAQRLPRFARWRRDLGHRIDAWRPTEGGVPDDLRGLLVGTTAWRWLATQDVQLQQITNPVHRVAYRARIADYLQRCEPAWPVTTLGL